MIVSAWSFLLVTAIRYVSGAEQSDQCDLYMAISSTSTAETTRWGLFAGKDFPVHTEIGYPEVGINVPNLRTNSNGIEETEEGQEFIDKIVTFFETFFWVPETIGAKYEQTIGRSVGAVPGAGVLGSYNKKLTNADWYVAKTYHRALLGDTTGMSHPNRGATSQFYSAQIISKKQIKAGSEIFLEFGESWAEQNEDDEEKDELTNEDFEKIDATIVQILDFFEKHKEVLDSRSRNEVYRFITNDVLKAAIGIKKSRQVNQILPSDSSDLYKVQEAGGAMAYRDPTIFRTVNWLSEYGFCMDNLRPGASTIPNAGRGAFATRNVANGTMVAPVPLTHFSDSRILDMYELNVGDDGELRKTESSTIVGRQLLENYCYGHPQSSMIFFPSGAGVNLINHSDKPNAKLVWSKHPSHQRQWLDLDPVDLVDEQYSFIGLIMEIVAIRDIEAGEEVFIDYGPEWKSAWETHVTRWNAKMQSGDIPPNWPLRAIDLNNKYISQPFETKDELVEPYPENVDLKAFLMLADSPHEGTYEDPKEWDGEDAFAHDNLFSVEVLEKTTLEDSTDDMPYSYMVRWVGKAKSSVIVGVPHSALIFVDKPGTSDQFTSNAFRHYIGIPDEIFPEGPWRNL